MCPLLPNTKIYEFVELTPSLVAITLVDLREQAGEQVLSDV
jgi:hypothetical protein